jgi:3'(2'),5'-bisphosphate nucleotidase
MTITQTELATLCHIAEAAGQEIMAVYREGGETWQKLDESPLTEADLRADRVIRQGLEEHFPGVFILSEESVSGGVRTAGRFFLVDPLDGTREFLKRNGEFTVNIALVEDGVPVAGVVLAPALDELFYAAQGLGAWKRDATGARAMATSPYDGARPLRVMGSRSHGGEALDAWLATLATEHSFVAAGSSLKFCRIAEGLADVYPRLGPTSQWDTAAAQAVLECAGGAVTDWQGAPLGYGLERPVLNPHFLAVGRRELLGRLGVRTAA